MQSLQCQSVRLLRILQSSFNLIIAKRKVKTCTAVAVQVFCYGFTVLNKFNCCAVSKHFGSLLHNRS